MTKVYILEDDQSRINMFDSYLTAYMHTDTVSQDSLELFLSYDPDIVFLDHDLGGRTMVDSAEENTGAGFVRLLVKNDPKIKERTFYVHSFNPNGSMEMVRTLLEVYATVYREPFGSYGFRAALADIMEY